MTTTRITPVRLRRILRTAVAACLVAAVMGVNAAPVLAAEKPETAAAEADDPSSTYVGPFVDDEGSTHTEGIAALWGAGITSGCGEFRFCPNDGVTREQMAAFLTRALELDAARRHPFRDVNGSQFADAIAAVANAGITRGCDTNKFCPEQTLTRGEMAAFLVRALSLPAGKGNTFVDDDGSIFEEDIEALAAAGITAGCGKRRYCPNDTITRAEMATMLTRALGLPQPEKVPAIPQHVIDAWEEEQLRNSWPTGPDPEGWRPLAEKYFRNKKDVDRAIDVIRCESSGYRYAANPTSSARGLFQHMGKFWKERSARAGVPGADIFDPEAQFTVAAWLVYEQGGWKHWYPSQHCWG